MSHKSGATLANGTDILANVIAKVIWFRGSASPQQWVQYVLLVVLVPMLGAWGTGQLITLLRPMREFDAADRHAIYLPALGVFAAVLTLLAMGVQAAFLSRLLADWSFGLSSSVVATTMVV